MPLLRCNRQKSRGVYIPLAGTISHSTTSSPIYYDQTYQGSTSFNGTQSREANTTQHSQLAEASSNARRRRDTANTGKAEHGRNSEKTTVLPPPKSASKSLNPFANLIDDDGDEQED
ncbi:hypothetical protein ONS96_013939 [Cadophora gregata f. sp. sojae]|nr:hypothetical protein ONS96_013939 [Cadophora gregata f. sp. sojae]